MSTEVTRLRTVLFDLDGTLLDTAPDLAYALNLTLEDYGRPVRSFEDIRPAVSHGATALIRMGFGIGPDHPDFEPARQRLLAHYREHLTRGTRPFPGMGELLDRLEALGYRWGVVTNKPAWLTEPLLEGLGLLQRAACVVSGDTVAERKPHPAPMLHACRLAGSQAGECLYVGDAERDIEAGRRAGMRTLVALFGYLAATDRPADWGADAMIAHPLEILNFIDAERAA